MLFLLAIYNHESVQTGNSYCTFKNPWQSYSKKSEFPNFKRTITSIACKNHHTPLPVFLQPALTVHSGCAHKLVENCERTVSKPNAKSE